MLVFISWSGSVSKFIAENLKSWLENVLQSLEPWLSIDIEKGKRWNTEVVDKLEKSKIGIICLTKENLDERWILFEAGALSRKTDSYVCTLLYELENTDVEYPLAQFQHTLSNKEDMLKLLQNINSCVGEKGGKPLKEQNLNKSFEKFWPDIENVFREAKTKYTNKSKPARNDRELLAEALELLRAQDNKVNIIYDKLVFNEILSSISKLSKNSDNRQQKGVLDMLFSGEEFEKHVKEVNKKEEIRKRINKEYR